MAFLDIPGGRLFYEDVGQGPAVVFIHGTTGNSDMWFQQVPAFVRAGYRCVRFDTRSYGRSTVATGQEGASTLADDVERIRTALNLGKIFLVGQANGAEGAIDYALDFPSTTSGVVAASSFRTGDAEPSHQALLEKLVPIDIRKRPPVELQLGATYRQNNPEGVRRFLEIDGANRRGRPSASMNQPRRAPSNFARLGRMTVPTLIVAASEDILTPPELMRDLADHIPKARFEIIDRAGRYAFWERPEAFNATVIQFFDGLRTRGRKLAPGIGVRRGTVRRSGRHISYEDTGTSYRKILFLPGRDGSNMAWRDRIPAFANAGYRCITYTSSPPQPGTDGHRAHDVRDLADALDLSSFFLVGGEQEGAGIALDLASYSSGLLRGVAVPFDGDDRTGRPISASVPFYYRSPHEPLFGSAEQAAAAEDREEWDQAVIGFLDGLA